MSPEYDAFGRPNRPAPGDGPARSSTSPRTPSDRDARDARRRRRGRRSPRPPRQGGCVGGLITLVVVGAVGVPIGIAVLAGDDGARPAESDREVIDRFVGSGKDARSSAAAAGDTKGMLSTGGTQQAFARLKAKMQPGDRITSLSIRPEYLSARIARGVGTPERSITIREDDEYESDGTTATERGVALEALGLDGPRRLIEAARRGVGPRSTATVGYVVLDVGRDRDDEHGWAVYLEGTTSEDSRWTSDIRGDHVLRPSDGAPAPPEGESGPARTPTGVAPSSMVRPENLRRAVRVVAEALEDDALVTSVDVRPKAVSFRVRRSFRERSYSVDATFGLEVGAVNETASRDGIPISEVNARGPERALRKIDSRRDNRAPERVDYVILSPRSKTFPQSRTVWLVYLQGGHPNGRYWRATADGRRIGRSGEAGAP